MITLLVKSGGVTWSSTRYILVNSRKFSRRHHVNFGIGPEKSAQCAHCLRILPTALMHVDHIYPRAGYLQRVLQPGTRPRFLSSEAPHGISTEWKGVVQAGTHVSMLRIGAAPPRTNVRTMTRGGGVVKHQHGYGLKHRTQAMVLGSDKTIRAEVIWSCNLDNLQWLCMLCNTSKGNRAFNTWSLRPAIPMTTYLP